MSVSERTALEKAVEANPRDLLLRLVLADYLEETGLDDLATYHRGWTLAKQDSLEWFRDTFCEQVGLPLDEVLGAAEKALEDGSYHDVGMNFQADGALYDEVSRHKFWRNFSTLTNREIGEDTSGHSVFQCGC